VTGRSELVAGESGGKCLIEQVFKLFLKDVIVSLDRIELGKSCRTLGATYKVVPDFRVR